MSATEQSVVGEECVGSADEVRYEMILFVNGASGPSARAIINARSIVELYSERGCSLSLVDLRDMPIAVEENHVFVTPTLIRKSPLPERRVIGDLSDRGHVLRVLGFPDAHDSLTASG